MNFDQPVATLRGDQCAGLGRDSPAADGGGCSDRGDRASVGFARNTVKAALASSSPPRYVRASAGSIVDAVEPAIRELLAEYPRIPATVIAERIGWDRGLTVLKDRVRDLRPVYLPDPASRTTYRAGEVAQFDFWFPPIEPGRRVRAVPTGDTVAGADDGVRVLPVAWRSANPLSPGEQDLYAGWWSLIRQLGAVPRVLVWDGEAAVGRWRAKTGIDRLLSAVPRRVGHQGRDLSSGRPGGQGHAGTHPRSLRAVVPARANVHRPGRLQPAVGAVAAGVQPSAGASAWDADRSTGSWPTPGNAGVAAGPAGHRVALGHPTSTGLLRAGRRQRLLGPPQRHRAARSRRGRSCGRACDLRGQRRGRACSLLGAAPNVHRRRPRGRGRTAAPGPLQRFRAMPAAAAGATAGSVGL